MLARGRRRATASTWRAWDWAFYSEQVRAERYAVDTAALRPCFELDRVLVDGVFHAAELLYGYRFTPRPDLAGYHPDVRVWEVTDADGDAGRALPRRLLRPRGQARRRLDELVRPRSRGCSAPSRSWSTTSTSPGPPDGQPTLLTLDEVEHALPRVRPRAARAELGGHLPAVLRHQRAARLRRVPEPGQRDVGAVAGGARATTPGTSRPASRCRPTSSRRSTPPGCGARASRPWSTWPRRCSTRPGTGSRPTPRSATRSRSSSRPWTTPASPRRSCRRATGRRTSSTSSPGATRPGTTPTSGRRCSTPTPWSGSRRTAACAGRTATPSAASCSSVGGSVDPLAAFRAVRGRDADPGPLLRRRGLATA